MAISADRAALAMVGVEGVFQIMAGMLPSPTTMAEGGASPERIKRLRRNRIQGGTLALGLLGAVSYFVAKEDRAAGWFLLIFGLLGFGLFWYESGQALRDAVSSGDTGRSGY